MKKLLIPILILLCFVAKAQYNPSGTYLTPLNRPIGLTGKPDGGRTYLYDPASFSYRPYVSVAEANAYVTGTARQGHFYVIINTGGILSGGVITGGTNAAFWWRDGIADVNLVPMNPAAGGSPNTSVGTGYSIAINGTNNVKSVISDLLTFLIIDSSLGSTVRFKLDTAGLVSYLNSHHPFVLKVQPDSGLVVFGSNSDSLRFNYLKSYLVSQDSIGGGNLYSKINGSFVLVGSVGGGGGSTLVYNTVTDMLAVRPANGTGAITLGYAAAGDLGGTNYTYNSASTASSNGRTVLTPTTGSGAGRYLLVVSNGEVRMRQLGYTPSSDNTSDFNGAAALAAGTFFLRPDINSTWIVDPNAGGFRPLSNLTIKGFGATSVIKSKAYTSQNKPLINRTPSGGTDTLFNFVMTGMTIDGNTTYTYPTLAGGSPVTDTLSELVHLELAVNWDIENNYFQNGGNYAGFYYLHTSYGTIANNFFNFIGSNGIANDYDSLSHDILVANNKFHHFGNRDVWDLATGGAPNRRAGNDWGSFGGYNIHIVGNEWWNDFKVMCFSVESKHVGPAFYLNNIAHAGSSYYGGYSVGGFDATKPLKGLVMQGNIIDSVVFRPLASQDSVSGHLKFFAGTNYNEFTYLQNATISGNIWPNSQMSLGYSNKNVSIFSNTFDCSGVLANYPVAGTGSQIFFDPTLHTIVSPVDTVQNVNFYNNTYISGFNGEFMRLDNNGALTKSLHIYNNPQLSFNAGILAEVYKPHGPTFHQDLQINNNIVTGSAPNYWFYSIDSTVGGHTFSFQNNLAGNTNMDSVSNLITNAGGAAVGVVKEGTTFLTGLYSRAATNISLSGSNLSLTNPQGVINTVVLPSSGGSSYTKAQIDSVINKVDVGGGSQYLRGLGDSYVTGVGATSSVFDMAYQISGYTQKIYDSSLAAGGTGGVQAIINLNRFLASYNALDILYYHAGFNDLRRYNDYRTFRKLQNNVNTLLINHYLGYSIGASDGSVTKGGGTWTAQDLHSLGSRSGNDLLSGQTVMYAQTNGANVTWTTPIPTNNITWHTYDSDSSNVTQSAYTVNVDGALITNPQTGTTTWSENAQCDGISDGFNNNQQMPNSHVYFTPNYKTHVVVITALSASTMYVDAFGYLMPFQNASAVIVHTIPKMLASSYALSPANGTPAIFNSGDSIINLTCAPFLARSYPVGVINVSNFFTPGNTNMSADSVHPNNLGYSQFAAADVAGINYKARTTFPIDNNAIISLPYKPTRNVKFGSLTVPNITRDVAGLGEFNLFNTGLGYPYMYFNNPGGSTNNKVYDWYSDNSGVFHWRAVSDDYLAAKDVLVVYRTGTTSIDSITSAAPIHIGGDFQSKYVDLVGVQPSTVAKSLTMGSASAGSLVFMDWFNAQSTANNGRWNFYADASGNFVMRTLNDNNTGAGGIFTINRTGTTVNYFEHDSKVGVLTSSTPDSALQIVGGLHASGGFKMDNPAKTAAKYVLHWDPTTHIISYADTSASGGGSSGVGFYNSDSTLSSNRTVSAGGHNLILGAAGDRLPKLILNADSTGIEGAVNYSSTTGTNANTTFPATNSILFLSSITANRTLTMPTPSTNKGRTVWVFNQNTAAFAWTFVANVADAAGNAITSIANGNALQLISDGTNWVVTGTLYPILGSQGKVASFSNTTNASTGSVLLYTTPNDGVTHVYTISAHANITALTAATLTATVQYTDENSTSETQTFFPMGSTTAAITSISASNFPVMGEVAIAPNTAVNFAFTKTGTSLTYNYSITLFKLY